MLRDSVPEFPGWTELDRSHLLPASKQSALGRRWTRLGNRRLRYVAHRPRCRHQPGGDLHPGLPAACVVLGVARPILGRDRLVEGAYFTCLGPRRSKARLTHQPGKPSVAQLVLRGDGSAELECTFDLPIPERSPIPMNRGKLRINSGSYRVGQPPPSLVRRIQARQTQRLRGSAVLAPRHHRNEAMRQRWRHPRVSWRTRNTIAEPCVSFQPEIHQRGAAQRRKHERRRAQLLEDRFHRLEGEPRQQRAAGPEIAHAAGRRDERLHRPEREGQKGRTAVRRLGSVQAGGDVGVLEQRVVRNTGIGGKPRCIVAKLLGDRVRQPPPDRKEPLPRPGQSPNDLFDDGNRLVRIEAVQAQIRVGSAGRMHDPETVRRTDCPFAVPASGRRGYALGDRGNYVGTRCKAVETPAGDLPAQSG